jgi:Ca2+-transporting ATPase
MEAVIAVLGSDATQGLTTEEARRRLAQYGPNELRAETPIPAWRKFLAQFQDVLIILLLIAVAISLIVWLYERDEPLPYEALGCVVVTPHSQRFSGFTASIADGLTCWRAA